MSNSLDPGKVSQNAQTDQDPDSLQKLSADDSIRQIIKHFLDGILYSIKIYVDVLFSYRVQEIWSKFYIHRLYQ